MDNVIGTTVSSGSMAGRSASASLSPSSPDESPPLEPIMTDVKILPSDYSKCGFPDLVDLIGALRSFSCLGPPSSSTHAMDERCFLRIIHNNDLARMLAQLIAINVVPPLYYKAHL